jgi:transketolase
VVKGAYVLVDAEGGQPDVILVATGSEVSLAVSARDELAGTGIRARVVSMPCSELFDRQPQEYRDEVLPPSVKARVAIEQASTLGWHRYVGDGGAIVGMHTFGASAPLKMLVEKFGFTPDAVAEVARRCVAAARGD